VLHILAHKNNLFGFASTILGRGCRNLNKQVELVTIIRFGKNRVEERGYNQVGLVGMQIAAFQFWQHKPHLIISKNFPN
jgi:predicted amidophosphoribosyltransferase